MPPNAELGRVVHNWLFSPLSYHTRLWPRGCEGTPPGAPSSCKACSLLGYFGRTSSKSRGGRPGPGRRVLDGSVEIASGACPVPKRSEESVVFFLLRLSIGASSLIIFSSLPSLIASFLPPPFFPPFVYALAPLQAAEHAEGMPQSQEEVIQDSPHGAQ